MKLYASGEDYLEAVLVLQRKQGMVRSVDLARGSPISMWVWTMRTRRPYYMVRLASQPDLGPCCGQH